MVLLLDVVISCCVDIKTTWFPQQPLVQRILWILVKKENCTSLARERERERWVRLCTWPHKLRCLLNLETHKPDEGCCCSGRVRSLGSSVHLGLQSLVVLGPFLESNNQMWRQDMAAYTITVSLSVVGSSRCRLKASFDIFTLVSSSSKWTERGKERKSKLHQKKVEGADLLVVEGSEANVWHPDNPIHWRLVAARSAILFSLVLVFTFFLFFSGLIWANKHSCLKEEGQGLRCWWMALFASPEIGLELKSVSAGVTDGARANRSANTSFVMLLFFWFPAHIFSVCQPAHCNCLQTYFDVLN